MQGCVACSGENPRERVETPTNPTGETRINVDKQAAISRLCALVTEVGGVVFNNQYPHDCFCQFSFHEPKIIDDKVIEFIESTVRARITETRGQ